MHLADLIHRYRPRLRAQYGASLRAEQWSALNAIEGCRTEQYGESVWACLSCQVEQHCFQACGHRSCPRCQNREASQWLTRQRKKLLPVDYFLVTFTLPGQLRPLARQYPRTVYAALFRCATETLKSFGLNTRLVGTRNWV